MSQTVSCSGKWLHFNSCHYYSMQSESLTLEHEIVALWKSISDWLVNDEMISELSISISQSDWLNIILSSWFCLSQWQAFSRWTPSEPLVAAGGKSAGQCVMNKHRKTRIQMCSSSPGPSNEHWKYWQNAKHARKNGSRLGGSWIQHSDRTFWTPRSPLREGSTGRNRWLN